MRAPIGRHAQPLRGRRLGTPLLAMITGLALTLLALGVFGGRDSGQGPASQGWGSGVRPGPDIAEEPWPDGAYEPDVVVTIVPTPPAAPDASPSSSVAPGSTASAPPPAMPPGAPASPTRTPSPTAGSG